jgi:peroxiredoxin
MPALRFLLLLAAIVAISAPGVDYLHAEPAAPASKLPQLPNVDGKLVDLSRPGDDVVVVAIFTRTDCPISNRYAPEVRRLYEKFHGQGVAFYLVFVDPRQQPADIRSHLKEYEYPCPALLDYEHALAGATGATVTPAAVVFDREGKRVYRGRIDDQFVDLGKSRAEATKHDLEDAVAATLAGKRVAEPVTQAVGCLIGDLK